MAVRMILSRDGRTNGNPEPLDVNPVRISVERQRGMGGWAARIVAVNPAARGGLDREFLQRESAQLSRADNGVVEFVIDRPGVYEIEYIYRSLRPARTYLAVYPDGRVTEIGWYERSEGNRPRAIDRAIKEALAEIIVLEGTGIDF